MAIRKSYTSICKVDKIHLEISMYLCTKNIILSQK